MKKQSLIKQDIRNQTCDLPYKHIDECPPILGKKIHDINVDVQKYRKTNAVLMSILSTILILVFIRFLVVLHHWLLTAIISIVIISCIIWTVFAIKKSLIKVEYVLYENYIVKSYEDACTYANNQKFKGYKIKTAIVDKMFKPRTQTIILYYNDKFLPYLKLSCIAEDINTLITLILKYCQPSENKTGGV